MVSQVKICSYALCYNNNLPHRRANSSLSTWLVGGLLADQGLFVSRVVPFAVKSTCCHRYYSFKGSLLLKVKRVCWPTFTGWLIVEFPCMCKGFTITPARQGSPDITVYLLYLLYCCVFKESHISIGVWKYFLKKDIGYSTDNHALNDSDLKVSSV